MIKRNKRFNLAQFNVARLRAPLESSTMLEFVNGLDDINSVADDSEGFVWRQKGEDGGPSTSIRPYGDDFIISFSVWESVEYFRDFVYRSRHREYYDRRAEWFLNSSCETLVMWWIEKGKIPVVSEAVDRLDRLREYGPSEDAFSFRSQWPAPT